MAAPKFPQGFHPGDLIGGMGGWVDHAAATEDSPGVDYPELVDLIDYLWDLLVSYEGPTVAKSALITWMQSHGLKIREWQKKDLEKAIKKRGVL